MKNLLIFISLLLLSPFLTSCEKNVEVVVEKKPILFRDTPYSKFVEGGKKWFKTGDEKTQVKYEGEIVNGVPNGQGNMTCCDGVKYVGGYKDGERNGRGTINSPDGKKYVGEWKDGNPHGQGTLTLKNGKKYVGEYKDGKRNGQGTMTFPFGGKYVGEWKNGKTWNGTGYDKNGNIQVNFVNGERK
jgi:hypothetical protein